MKIRRREFLIMAGVIGAGAVVSLYSRDIQRIFMQATQEERHVIWLQGASDSGCTMSLLQGVNPDLVDVIRDFRRSVDFHPTLMVPAGDVAQKILDHALAGIAQLDLLIVEGAVPEGTYCTVGERNGVPIPFEDWVKVLGSKAKRVVAVGTCAAFGGISAANPNPTRSRSVGQVLSERNDTINIRGCPPHPDWITVTLADALSGQVVRPGSLPWVGGTPHEQCKLREFYDRGRFARDFGEEPLLCLYELGCRGKEGDVIADCIVRLWNNKVNVCQYAGAPCIGCVSPRFPDGMSPFYEKLQGS